VKFTLRPAGQIRTGPNASPCEKTVAQESQDPMGRPARVHGEVGREPPENSLIFVPVETAAGPMRQAGVALAGGASSIVGTFT
jgi:hypothetical protein